MKITKKKKKIIVGISAFLATIGVSAATYMYSANNITYSNSSLSGTDAQTALENLITKYQNSTTTCPSGVNCTPKTNIKCRRATTLHTETCTNSDTSYFCQGAGYAVGDTITYGNKTITEGVLTTGDAFDCDVNGDGNVSAIDARWILQYAAMTREFDDKQFAAADVNGDGKVSAMDARWVLQAVAGTRVL